MTQAESIQLKFQNFFLPAEDKRQNYRTVVTSVSKNKKLLIKTKVNDFIYPGKPSTNAKKWLFWIRTRIVVHDNFKNKK